MRLADPALSNWNHWSIERSAADSRRDNGMVKLPSACTRSASFTWSVQNEDNQHPIRLLGHRGRRFILRSSLWRSHLNVDVLFVRILDEEGKGFLPLWISGSITNLKQNKTFVKEIKESRIKQTLSRVGYTLLSLLVSCTDNCTMGLGSLFPFFIWKIEKQKQNAFVKEHF